MIAIDTINKSRKTRMRYSKKHTPKMDMTPMVDLGFLLISFFVITTELSKPATIDLNMPKDGTPIDLGESDALMVLLGKDNTVYYYHGDWNKAIKTNGIFQSNLSVKDGLGKLIREKQQRLDIINLKEGRNGLMLLIKPGKDAVYSNVIDMLDEALIHNVKKYALLKQEKEEVQYLENSNHKGQ